MDRLSTSQYVFLLCSERSGSNFLTKLMNNHSEICGPSTKHIINPSTRNLFRYQPLSSTKNWNQLVNDVLNLFNASFSVWNSDFSIEELQNEVEPGNLFDLLNYMFSKETRLNDKTYCFVKEIKVHEFYPFLKHYFPEASYVHLVRDPRDMALSWKKSAPHRGGVVAAARQWKTDQQQYLKILDLEQQNFRSTSLKYEDLVLQTKEKLQETLDLIDLNFENQMVDMKSDALTKVNSQKHEVWKNLSKPVMRDNYNKYEKELSAQEIKYIEAICYFEMTYLGYQTEYDWDELASISNAEINSFNAKELAEIEYAPDKGIKENMEAKKRFYQHSN